MPHFSYSLVLACVLWSSAGPGLAQTSSTVDLPPPLSAADFRPVDPEKAELGRLLFYDKILSGNRNISCGTCHHPRFGTSDGLSLGLGEGGADLGPDRRSDPVANPVQKRIPRNAPALWNLGAFSLTTLMHDGRISADPVFGNGFNTPAEEWLPQGLESVLAAQAVFPITSSIEMAGNVGENEVIGAARDRIDAVWPILAKRVRVIPEYGDRFMRAFPDLASTEDVTIVHIANALAHFMVQDFTSFDSPFDRYLAGDKTALTPLEIQGLDLFFGEAACHTCHSGPLFTDQKFYALGLPAFGPGRSRSFDPYARDVGRMGETDDLDDAYRFRTPSLRNVALTAPYGHNGAYPTLTDIIRHHLDPDRGRATWTPAMLTLPDVPWLSKIDFVVQQDRFEMARQAQARDIDIPPRTDPEIAALVAFLNSLTGDRAARKDFAIPAQVPSGLPVDKD